MKPAQNPIQVDGYWFGVGEHRTSPHYPSTSSWDTEYEEGFWLHWTCPSCGKLRPALRFYPVDLDFRLRSAKGTGRNARLDWESYYRTMSGTEGRSYEEDVQYYRNRCKAEFVDYVEQAQQGHLRFDAFCPYCGATKQK